MDQQHHKLVYLFTLPPGDSTLAQHCKQMYVKSAVTLEV